MNTFIQKRSIKLIKSDNMTFIMLQKISIH